MWRRPGGFESVARVYQEKGDAMDVQDVMLSCPSVVIARTRNARQMKQDARSRFPGGGSSRTERSRRIRGGSGRARDGGGVGVAEEVAEWDAEGVAKGYEEVVMVEEVAEEAGKRMEA